MLDQKVVQVLPKSLLSVAIAYTLGLWPKPTTYLEDGHIEIDNNKAENAIRSFVVGSKAVQVVRRQAPRSIHG